MKKIRDWEIGFLRIHWYGPYSSTKKNLEHCMKTKEFFVKIVDRARAEEIENAPPTIPSPGLVAYWKYLRKDEETNMFVYTKIRSE